MTDTGNQSSGAPMGSLAPGGTGSSGEARWRSWIPVLGGLLAAIVLSTCLGPPAAAAPAHAKKPRLSTSDKRRARRLFFKGLNAFARQQYPDALALFLASFKIRPKSVVLYNIGNCYKALFQYRRAINTFRRYIRQRGRKLALWRRRQIERIIAAMARRLGRLKLGVSPEGASVRVDGRVVGRAPLASVVLVDPGRRMVEISAPGYRTVRTQVTVTAGQLVSLGIRLQPKALVGKVFISSPVEGARASIDGGPPRPLPLELELSVGSHKVRVGAPGHSSQALTVLVHPGETTRENVGLIPLGLGGAARPVYKRWWFWTLVSVAVVAAGVTTGMLVWDRARGDTAVDLSWQLR